MDFKKIALIAALLATLSVFSTTAVVAEDLTDNETCAECHAGGGSDDPMDVPGATIHTPAGGFTVEAHEMWSCVDCHAMVSSATTPFSAAAISAARARPPTGEPNFLAFISGGATAPS